MDFNLRVFWFFLFAFCANSSAAPQLISFHASSGLVSPVRFFYEAVEELPKAVHELVLASVCTDEDLKKNLELFQGFQHIAAAINAEKKKLKALKASKHEAVYGIKMDPLGKVFVLKMMFFKIAARVRATVTLYGHDTQAPRGLLNFLQECLVEKTIFQKHGEKFFAVGAVAVVCGLFACRRNQKADDIEDLWSQFEDRVSLMQVPADSVPAGCSDDQLRALKAARDAIKTSDTHCPICFENAAALEELHKIVFFHGFVSQKIITEAQNKNRNSDAQSYQSSNKAFEAIEQRVRAGNSSGEEEIKSLHWCCKKCLFTHFFSGLDRDFLQKVSDDSQKPDERKLKIMIVSKCPSCRAGCDICLEKRDLIFIFSDKDLKSLFKTKIFIQVVSDLRKLGLTLQNLVFE